MAEDSPDRFVIVLFVTRPGYREVQVDAWLGYISVEYVCTKCLIFFITFCV